MAAGYTLGLLQCSSAQSTTVQYSIPDERLEVRLFAEDVVREMHGHGCRVHPGNTLCRVLLYSTQFQMRDLSSAFSPKM